MAKTPIARNIGGGATSRGSNDLIGPFWSSFCWLEKIEGHFMVDVTTKIRRALNSNPRIVKMTFVLTKAFERTCHSSGK